jgi:CheY-like chemotaxis protein
VNKTSKPDRYIAGSKAHTIFIVEDEGMVSMLLKELLEELGYAVVDTAANLADALNKAATTKADAAILDVNLDGENTLPVAAELGKRGIPYMFATGYGQGPVEQSPEVPVLSKPFALDDLERILADLLR